ncbi:MAG TPA: chromosomal replication initiator protein DnaA [Candidatus Scatomorpha stercorigallinarum]|nr:chromosomal replication initiator protein DnaA [Candidatus Scatomorpha stercorigallinarum]
MDSVAEVWKSILEIIARDITPTAYNTWFADCEPVELEDCKLVLHTATDFKRNIIQSRFGSTICAALYDLFSCDFELQVLAGDELEEYLSRKKGPDHLPEMDGYTFDRFVVGPSNKFAHAAAVAVAENPGKAYNPLFIYGNSGLGKTHLLLAIGEEIHARHPEKKIAYVKGDDFTNQMIQSVQSGTAEEFRQKYRNVDLFLVDDVQFIAGKQATQEEFFHTFNNIYEAGHQIVITSDRPPLEMSLLDDRLRTRFEGGLMADVQPPDIETRMAIIRNKAAQLGMILPDDVVEYIGENITANIRQIEGVVKRLTAYKEILNDTITINSVKRAIKDVIRVGEYIPTPDVIIEETARYYSLSPDDLRGQRRSKNIAMARQISMYLMRSLTNLSLLDIGEQYEGRNHSTVLSSVRKVEDLIKKDPEVASTVRDISSNINSRS